MVEWFFLSMGVPVIPKPTLMKADGTKSLLHMMRPYMVTGPVQKNGKVTGSIEK